MAIKIKFNNTTFRVGDLVRVTQKIKEGEKTRSYNFEGVVIGVKGRGETQTFTVRRIGEARIGIEKIFPLQSPTIENIKIVREGGKGVRRAKLYYIRKKSKREIDKIYSRRAKKSQRKEKLVKNTPKKKTKIKKA